MLGRRARADLPRLPAARHRVEHLQRRAGAGVGATRATSCTCSARSAAPLELAWVDAAGDWDAGALELATRRDPPRATVYRPDLGGLLPVYVADRYEGIEARPYEDLDDAEVAAYVERNVAAVAEVVARARPDVALANHLVMGPLILARALAGTGVPYAVKIHGSALEYTVKRHPRFLPAARAGLAGARGVLVGSRHTGESLWAAVPEPGLRERTRLGPPGVDVRRFAPREPEAAAAGLRELARTTRAGDRCGPGGILVRALERRGRRGARGDRSAARPDRPVRRQADRLEGRRAAARRLAAGARARAGGAAARGRVRRVQERARAARRRARARGPRGCAGGARRGRARAA